MADASTRHAYDFYPTPLTLAQSALSLLPDGYEPRAILDAGCGDGVWGQAARQKWGDTPHLVGTDIRDVGTLPGYNLVYQYDFLNALSWQNLFPLVMGNPPFSQAEEFVRHAHELAARGGYVLMLLRLAMLEGQKRGADFWPHYKPVHVAVLSRRPSFTGDSKTDRTAYGVFLWHVGSTEHETTLSWLDWEPEKSEG